MRLERTRRDGTAVVVKHTGHPAEFEAEGLAALAGAGAPVPMVHEVGANHLVMDDLDAANTARHDGRPATDTEWAALGAALAGVHRDVGTAHGWHRNNVIGATTQHNAPDADWATFHWDQRLAPHLEVLPATVGERLRSAREPLAERLDHDVVASLLHGDIWSGNVLHGRWFIDPAVCRGDRELDLAFAALFGGIPTAFTAGYDDAWPRDDGWQERLPLLQLYHLLVHVRLFGDSYLPPVVARLDAAGL